jgi:hypothetical protein
MNVQYSIYGTALITNTYVRSSTNIMRASADVLTAVGDCGDFCRLDDAKNFV